MKDEATERSGASVAPHTLRVVNHYDALTPTFYLTDYDPEHLHWGYWDEPPGAGTPRAFDRQAQATAVIGMIDAVTAPANIEPDDLVVDAGCGVGGTARFLAAQHRCRVLGLDVTPSQVQRASKLTRELAPDEASRIEYRIADATAPWDVPPETVDVVVSLESACHYEHRDAYLHEVATALRPGGRLVLQDGIRTEPMSAGQYVRHINPICQAWQLWSIESLAGYEELISAAGLRIVDAVDLGPHVLPNAHHIAKAARRYELAEEHSHASRLDAPRRRMARRAVQPVPDPRRQGPGQRCNETPPPVPPRPPA